VRDREDIGLRFAGVLPFAIAQGKRGAQDDSSKRVILSGAKDLVPGVPKTSQTLRRAGWLFAAALILAVGCASAPTPASEAREAGAVTPAPAPAPASSPVPTPAPTVSDTAPRQLLVTLPAGSERLWRQVALDITQLTALRLDASWFMASIGQQCLVFQLPAGRDAQRVARLVASVPHVAVAQPTQTYRLLGAPEDDPYLHLQSAATVLHLEPAHRLATGKGVKVALIDTGVDFEHPDLRERVASAENFVDHGDRTFTRDSHGTAVAGVLAAQAGNGIGIVGVAPEADLFALKACWPESAGSRSALCDSYTLARALDFAITRGAQVINLSLAGPFDALLALQIQAALARRIVVVAAAEGSDGGFPASLPGVLGVRGVDLTRSAAPLDEDGGKGPRLAAPDVDLLTTAPAGTYDFFSGSSFAAAQASGVVALLLERRPELGTEQIARLILDGAHAMPAAGNGDPPALLVLDACATLAAAIGQKTGC
jgi:subtilisin family serine protease